jgi:CRISPR-associated protein Cmr5
MTRSQSFLSTAAARVQKIKDDPSTQPWQKTYGGLCHSFPVLVRTAGLAQAIAFHESKKEGRPAHKQLLDDFAVLMEENQPGFDIAAASLSDYMQATRLVLSAWVFYKRFAKSILDVDAGDRREEDGDA